MTLPARPLGWEPAGFALVRAPEHSDPGSGEAAAQDKAPGARLDPEAAAGKGLFLPVRVLASAGAESAHSSGETAGDEPANADETGRARPSAGTSTSHSALPRALASALTAGPAPHVVSLAEAYRAAMRQDGAGARAALAKCAAELLGEADCG